MIKLYILVCLTILLNLSIFISGERVLYELKELLPKEKVVHVVPFKGPPLEDKEMNNSSTVVTIQRYPWKPSYVSIERPARRRYNNREGATTISFNMADIIKERKANRAKILIDAKTVRPVLENTKKSSGKNVENCIPITEKMEENSNNATTSSSMDVEKKVTSGKSTDKSEHSAKGREDFKTRAPIDAPTENIEAITNPLETSTAHDNEMELKTTTNEVEQIIEEKTTPSADKSTSTTKFITSAQPNLDGEFTEEDMQNMFPSQSNKPKRMSVRVAPGDYPIYYVRGRYNGKFGKFPIKAFGSTKAFMKYILSTKSTTLQ